MPGHAFFSIFNRTVNPIVKGLLLSPLHRVASRSLVLITVTGRRSGRPFTFPVNHSREGDRLLIRVGAPESKLWWRNLRQPAQVGVRLGGVERSGQAVARGDVRAGVTVEVTLDPAIRNGTSSENYG